MGRVGESSRGGRVCESGGVREEGEDGLEALYCALWGAWEVDDDDALGVDDSCGGS